MSNIDIKKNFYLPIVTLLPCFIYSLLNLLGVLPMYAILAALLISIIGYFLGRYIFKSWPASLAFIIITTSLITTLIVYLIIGNYPIHRGFFFIFFEVSTVISIVFSRHNRGAFRLFYIRKKIVFQRKLVKSFYDIGELVCYLFACHLFLILIYKFLEDADKIIHISVWDYILFYILPFVITLIVMGFELVKATALYNKVKQEEWLPIITEKGDVTGRIAKSVSLNMNDRFRHPVVRTALVCGEKIYLQERQANDILSPGKLDYPFEKYTLFNHGIEEAVKNNIAFVMADNNKSGMKLQYLMKYAFENSATKRLIFLFMAKIDDEDQIKRTQTMTGKFWTFKQIEEAFADEILSENFELEFEYIKNTILEKSGIDE